MNDLKNQNRSNSQRLKEHPIFFPIIRKISKYTYLSESAIRCKSVDDFSAFLVLLLIRVPTV